MMTSKTKYILQARDFISVYSILKSNGRGNARAYSFQLESADNHSTHSTSGDEDGLDRSHSLAGVTDTTASSPSNGGGALSMSDAEYLIRSAFGYKWIKFVPIEKIELLRKRFEDIMDVSKQIEMDRSPNSAAVASPTASSEVRAAALRKGFFTGIRWSNPKKKDGGGGGGGGSGGEEASAEEFLSSGKEEASSTPPPSPALDGEGRKAEDSTALGREESEYSSRNKRHMSQLIIR